MAGIVMYIEQKGRVHRSLAKENTRISAQAGFTLLEVLVAVVILGLVYVAVLQNFSFSLQNVLRVEKSKEETLASALAFEDKLRPADEEAGEPKKVPVGPVFLAGHQYNLVLVTSEDHQFMTLQLTRPGPDRQG
jgi:prepilin-type N-terminal cleavage/methylation domain-containing protein